MKKIIILFLIIQAGISAEGFTAAYLTKKNTDLHVSMNGMKIGQIKDSAPFEILEEETDWVKINLVGWVRKADVNMTAAPTIIEITSFEKEKLSGRYDIVMRRFRKKVRLKIFCKNNAEKKISAWEALLSIKNPAGKKIFTINVVSKEAHVKPGEEQEIDLQFEEEQFKNKEAFAYFESAKPENLRIKLSEIAFETEPADGKR